ncbi:MAG: threonine aldolase family protein [Mycobacteriales bacterium]
MIDLRSDTVTRPSEAMRRAMASADVGDDVYGEDPTINRLEATVAGLFGHAAALFVPSGIMGNQLAIRTLVPPAGELLCCSDAHIVTYEGGAPAWHGGIQTRTWAAGRGILDVDTVLGMVREDDGHTSPTIGVAVENTHNRGGGSVQPIKALRALSGGLRDRGVLLHCDGARIWNAHVATGTPLAGYGACFDTLSVCLSKGLGAPVGSVMVSSVDRIALARRYRQRLGGQMRQAGILAAAGLFALRHNVERLAEDHANARLLAGALGVDSSTVDTNILLVDVPDSAAFVKQAETAGVRCVGFGPVRVRLVTHLDVGRDDVVTAAQALAPLPAG